MLIKTIVIIMLVALLDFAQHTNGKQMIILHSKNTNFGTDPYNKKDTTLINNINRLVYDSVKIFSFNCEKIDWNYTLGFKLDSSKLYYKSKTGNPFFIDGKRLRNRDAVGVINIFKASYKDDYRSDFISPYIPTMGLAFFNKGAIIAHIEISLVTRKIHLEIFKVENKSYSFDWIVLGQKTRKFFGLMCEKYKLLCCN